ncbi:MAG: hypothetical protein ACYTXC_04350 [Nostoc sp.]
MGKFKEGALGIGYSPCPLITLIVFGYLVKLYKIGDLFVVVVRNSVTHADIGFRASTQPTGERSH